MSVLCEQHASGFLSPPLPVKLACELFMRKIALTALKAEVFLSQYKLCHGAVALAIG